MTACSATQVEAAGRCRARHGSAMADGGALHLVARAFAAMGPSAAAEELVASARTEGAPERPMPAVSNWEAAEMRVAAVPMATRVLAQAELVAITAPHRTIRWLAWPGTRLARRQCPGWSAATVPDRQAAVVSGLLLPTCRLWRSCAVGCGPGPRQGYPRPIGRRLEFRWRARTPRFEGSGSARHSRSERKHAALAQQRASQIAWIVPAHWLWHWSSATRE